MPSWPSASPLAQGVLYVPTDSDEPPLSVPTGITGYVPALFNPLTESFWVYLNGTWIDLSGGGGSLGHRVFETAADDTRPASIDLLNHFRTLLVGVTDADDEGAILQVCNGQSWFTVAYLNPHPRMHGSEAHLATGGGTVTQSYQETAFDQSYSDIVGQAVMWSDAVGGGTATAIPMLTNEVYDFEFRLYYDGHTNDDFRFGLYAPNGGAGKWAVHGPNTEIASLNDATTVFRTGVVASFTAPLAINVGNIGVGTSLPLRAWGRIRASAPGGLQFHYARRFNNSGTAGTGTPARVLAFSSVLYRKVN